MIVTLLQFLSQIRIFHWQTDLYNHHVIFGELYDAMDGLTDEILEVSFGQGYSKKLDDNKIIVTDIDTVSISTFLNDYISFILDIKEQNPDLTNICDTMVDTINRKKYLLEMS